MNALYQGIDDSQLRELIEKKSGAEVLNLIEEENSLRFDLGELWDFMHFMLTGSSAKEPIEDDLLSEAIVGVIPLDTRDFIAYTHKSRLHCMIEELEGIDLKEKISYLEISECKEANLYPEIWDDRAKVEVIINKIEKKFNKLINFYKDLHSKNLNVLIKIA